MEWEENILKPQARERLAELSREAVKTLFVDWETLFNTSMPLGVTSIFLKTDRNIAQLVDEKILHTRAVVTGDLKGKMFFLFPFDDAIILAGLMISLSEDEIRRKSSQNIFTETDIDAYKEACNILCGSVAKGMRIFLNKDFSIIQEETKLMDFLHSKIDFKVDFPQLPWIISEHLFRIGDFKKDESKLWMIYPKDMAIEILGLFNLKTQDIFGIVTERILLIDPSKQNQRNFLNILEQLSLKGYVASCYSMASEVLQSRIIDYVIVDTSAGMDERYGDDGLSICKKIKTHDKFKKIPVIMCGHNISKNMIIEGMKNGVCDFISKPFTISTFTERIKKWK